MEQDGFFYVDVDDRVLILVLMEYKWNIRMAHSKTATVCLNPCFNGIQMEPNKFYLGGILLYKS